MTLTEAAMGITIKKAVYNIGFSNGDETQFIADNAGDLESLWNDFCNDEGCAKDSVDYVEYALPCEGDEDAH